MKSRIVLFAGLALALAGTAYAATLPAPLAGVFRLFGGTPATYPNGAAVEADGSLDVAPTAGKKATCAASIVGLVPDNSAGDVFTLTGSASTTVRVTRVQISGRATAAASADVLLIKRSAVNTGGTSTAPTPVPYIAGGACSATVAAYSANPTVGTAVGTIRSQQLGLGNLTTAMGGVASFTFGDRPSQAPSLIGTAQALAVNLHGQTYSGGLFDIDIEWTEE